MEKWVSIGLQSTLIPDICMGFLQGGSHSDSKYHEIFMLCNILENLKAISLILAISHTQRAK